MEPMEARFLSIPNSPAMKNTGASNRDGNTNRKSKPKAESANEKRNLDDLCAYRPPTASSWT
jgi:hypothetical protein